MIRLFLISLFALSINQAECCTGVYLKSEDGAVVRGRTLEFGVDLNYFNVIYIPKNISYKGTTPQGNNGAEWTTKYDIVGTNIFEYQHIIDGLNEKGLSVGLFYFPGFANYIPYSEQDANKSLAPWELGTFILGQCATLDEVRQALNSIKVVPVVAPQLQEVAPIHYIFMDPTGQSIVVEYLKGELHVFDNPIGVITNSPSFDWHLTHLRNYINLKATDAPSVEINGLSLSQLGEGSGMKGLPGDFTPPSRFVRATFFMASSIPSKTSLEALNNVFHILNTGDIPKGSIRSKEGNDATQFTCACDLKNLKYYFHTFLNRQIQSVDLTQLSPYKTIQWISMQSPQSIKNMTPLVEDTNPLIKSSESKPVKPPEVKTSSQETVPVDKPTEEQKEMKESKLQSHSNLLRELLLEFNLDDQKRVITSDVL